MGKRFVETTIWTQNKWFRKLEPQHKIMWFYMLTNCDMVGVWEEDFELASFIIKFDYNKDNVYEIFKDKIKILNDKKIWVIDFCNFQYGELKEENIKNRPHQSYITLLKNHRLWIDYTKSIQRLKEKDKEKDKDINYNILVEKFNEYCSKMSKILSLTDIRKSHINARVEEHDFDTIINVFKIAGESDFLNGVNDKQWKATFDWLMKPTNFVKVLEGNYNNKERLQMMV